MMLVSRVRRYIASLPWHRFAELRRQRVFFLLLLADAVFIFLHVGRSLVRHYDLPLRAIDHDNFALDIEGSYSEIYQHAKLLVIAALLWRVSRYTGARVYLALAGTFAYIALDDALELHERAGVWLARAMDVRPLLGIDGRFLAELLFLGAVGSALLLTLIIAAAKSDGAHVRNASLFAVPFAAFVFLGGGIDVLHVVAHKSFAGANLILTVLEDGGELLAITLAFGLAWMLSNPKVQC